MINFLGLNFIHENVSSTIFIALRNQFINHPSAKLRKLFILKLSQFIHLFIVNTPID